MPVAIVPLLVGTVGPVALAALTKPPRRVAPTPVTPVTPKPTPTGPKIRPLPKTNPPLPDGTPIALVQPACGLPTDPPNCNDGLFLNKNPQPSGGSVAAGALGPPGSPVHPYTGEEVGVLQQGITASDGSGGEWWQVYTPGGATGYVRYKDPQGRTNLSLTGEVTGGGVAANPNPLPPPPAPNAFAGCGGGFPYPVYIQVPTQAPVWQSSAPSQQVPTQGMNPMNPYDQQFVAVGKGGGGGGGGMRGGGGGGMHGGGRGFDGRGFGGRGFGRGFGGGGGWWPWGGWGGWGWDGWGGGWGTTTGWCWTPWGWQWCGW